MPSDPTELQQLYAARLADENAPNPARDARIAELEREAYNAAPKPVRQWPAESERRLKPRETAPHG